MACDWRSAAILVQVSEGMLGLFCNWLSSVRQTLQIRNDIFVALHGSNLEPVRQSLAALGIAREHVLEGNASVHARTMGNFGGGSFYALNTAKITYALDLLERKNRPIIFSDIDVVWLRDPLAHLARALDRQAAFAIGPDANDKLLRTSEGASQALTQRHHVCACFFAACPSAAWLLRDWRSAASPAVGAGGAAAGAINEQKAFQRLLDRRPDLVLRGNRTGTIPTSPPPRGGGSPHERNNLRHEAVVAILDPAHFPTGQKDPPIAPSHVWLHANWIQRRTRASTTTAKKLRLQKRGVWNRSCASYV